MSDNHDNKNLKFPCVIPSVPEDYNRMHNNFHRFLENLPIDRFVFIGPESLRHFIEKDISDGVYKDNSAEFLNENELIDIKAIKPIYDDLLSRCTCQKPSSINWYYQQFLKMAYSSICPKDYYLCWDSDTVPLKKIDMFNDDGKPYLDVKTEYQNSYFKTIERLFGYQKIIEKSFISEHMIFSKALMAELISDIEESQNVSGEKYYEKILNAVGPDNLRTGFSEFETYGTWIGNNHPSCYRLRGWSSFRNANFFVDISNIDDSDIAWLSRDYSAATFEKYQPEQEELKELFRNPRYREKLSPRQFYVSVLESGIMGDYVNGMIKIDDQYFPV